MVQVPIIKLAQRHKINTQNSRDKQNKTKH